MKNQSRDSNSGLGIHFLQKQRKKRKKSQIAKIGSDPKATRLPRLKRGREATPRSSFPRFSLVFQVQRSVTSLMTLLSTQYKTPRHPSLQIEPIHRILIPRVILSVPTPQFHVYALFQICSRCLSYEFHAAPVRVIPHSLAKICSICSIRMKKKEKRKKKTRDLIRLIVIRDDLKETLKSYFGTK